MGQVQHATGCGGGFARRRIPRSRDEESEGAALLERLVEAVRKDG
jgi:hypothetical protein